MSKGVLRTALAVPKTAGKPSHNSAQRKLKKVLGIRNKIDEEAYVSMGRCMDEVASVVMQRWIAMCDTQGQILKNPLALSGIMSMVPADRHAEINARINDPLDAYYADPPSIGHGERQQPKPKKKATK